MISSHTSKKKTNQTVTLTLMTFNEAESDEIDLSSSSEDDEDAHVSAEVIALSSDEDDGDAQAPAEEGDKSLFVVEAGKRCPSCGLFDQETDTNTNVSVCMACYLDYSGTSPFKTGETAQEACTKQQQQQHQQQQHQQQLRTALRCSCTLQLRSKLRREQCSAPMAVVAPATSSAPPLMSSSSEDDESTMRFVKLDPSQNQSRFCTQG
jgi:hypothetical protein